MIEAVKYAMIQPHNNKRGSMAKTKQKWITLKQAVEITGMSRPTLRAFIKEYKIPCKVNIRDKRERLVDYEVLKRILEE